MCGQLQASLGAFAAIRADGSVVTWGRPACKKRSNDCFLICVGLMTFFLDVGVRHPGCYKGCQALVLVTSALRLWFGFGN